MGKILSQPIKGGMTTRKDVAFQTAKNSAEKKARMSLPNFKMAKPAKMKLAPTYKIPSAPKVSGAGWGGEKPSKK